MKRTIILAAVLAMVGCGKTPEPQTAQDKLANQIAERLANMTDEEKAELAAEQERDRQKLDAIRADIAKDRERWKEQMEKQADMERRLNERFQQVGGNAAKLANEIEGK